jgi:YfiH family protein
MSLLPALTHPRLSALKGISHAFFTRQGGVSTGIYDSLNLGRGSKDAADDVAENRRRAAAHFGRAPDQLLTGYQTHSTTVLAAETLEGAGSAEGDAVMAHRPGLICGALSADCAPILLADAEAGLVCAAHAGWKGALDGMAQAAVAAMLSQGARADRIVAVVGPCIGPNSYEVGQEFLDRFEAGQAGSSRFFRPGPLAGKHMFDLPGFVLHQLEEAGVVAPQWSGHDTLAAPDLFYSNRRAVHRGEGDYGRLLSAIMLDGG